ncbi:prepilin peptidase [Facklamia sp. 7083-14-GEN3]|uniref:prepilin peptidase n=1 Tax=Facklamia sp. 7083-14-GEN3 TaxID=2973478 RepID=UPI0037BE8AC1
MAYFLYFYIGSCLASFVYYLSYSIINDSFEWKARSSCDHCQHKLYFWQLFPLFSYLLLKGRCYFCYQKINITNFHFELIGGLFSLFIFSNDGFSWFNTILLLILLFMTFMDILDQWVPDSLQLSFLLLGLIYNYSHSIIPFRYFLIFCFFSFLLMITEQYWIGGADLKFICTSLLFIHLDSMPYFLFLAASSGLLYCYLSNSKKIPFIPFLMFSFISNYILI